MSELCDAIPTYEWLLGETFEYPQELRFSGMSNYELTVIAVHDTQLWCKKPNGKLETRDLIQLEKTGWVQKRENRLN